MTLRHEGHPNVPTAEQAPCTQCGKPMDTRCIGSAREVRGWTILREAGGANMVAWQEPLGRYLCATCVRDRKGGRAWDQLTLWEP